MKNQQYADSIMGQLDFDSYAPSNILECPVCGFDFVHVGEVEKRDGKDDYKAWSGRGSCVYIHLRGECGHAWNLCIGEHKGRCHAFVEQIEPETKLESPIEEMFWKIAEHEIAGLVPQHPVGRYRLDFAIPEKQVAIELDGHDYHKTKEQRTNDAQRERFLMERGWQVIRFTGSEVYRDASSCVAQVGRIVGNGTSLPVMIAQPESEPEPETYDDWWEEIKAKVKRQNVAAANLLNGSVARRVEAAIIVTCVNDFTRDKLNDYGNKSVITRIVAQVFGEILAVFYETEDDRFLPIDD